MVDFQEGNSPEKLKLPNTEYDLFVTYIYIENLCCKDVMC